MAELDQATMWEQVSEIAVNICTEWEVDFLESIEERAKREDLSSKQLEILKKLYRKACESKY